MYIYSVFFPSYKGVNQIMEFIGLASNANMPWP